MTNSRQKGASFERRIAKMFRAQLGEAWTVRREEIDNQRGQFGGAGDLRFYGPSVWPYAVECKHSKAFRMVQVWARTGPFQAWWDQACDQAQTVDKLPLLVFRGDRTPIWCATAERLEADMAFFADGIWIYELQSVIDQL